MKVLHIHTSSSPGGAATVARELVQHQRQIGVGAELHAGWGPQDTRQGIHSFETLRIVNLLNVAAYRLFAYPALLSGHAWKALLKSDTYKKADVIHLHNAHGYYLPDRWLKKIIQKPVVWTLHDHWLLTGRCASPAPCQGYQTKCAACPHTDLYPSTLVNNRAKEYIRRRAYLQMDHIVFTTPSVGAKQTFVNAGIQPDRIEVIPNPIANSRFTPAAELVAARNDSRRKLSIPAKQKVVLFAARKLSDEKKGLTTFIEALAKSSNNEVLKDALYIFIGEGNHETDKKIEGLNLTSQCPGLITDPKRLRQYYHASDLLVSSTIAETFGLVPVEAVAAGAGVLCSDLPVLREVLDVTEGDTPGIKFFPLRNSQTLHKKLVQMLTNEDSLPSDVYRARLLNKYGADTVTARFQRQYERAVGQYPPDAL